MLLTPCASDIQFSLNSQDNYTEKLDPIKFQIRYSYWIKRKIVCVIEWCSLFMVGLIYFMQEAKWIFSSCAILMKQIRQLSN